MPDPLGFMDYHTNLRSNADRLSSQLTSGAYRPSQPLRVLSEKSKGLCRQIVLPTIDDAIVLQRLSDSFFTAIRGKTPANHAYFEPDNFSFSNRTSYGNFAAWLHFQKHVFELCKKYRYVIISDIANYYDNIGYVSLRNIISATVSVSETVMDLLIFVLGGLTWQPDYMPRVDVGLPQIDLDAPRVLAHSFLFDLDRYAEDKVGDSYTRYMDDINFGVDSVSEAKGILRDVDIILHTRQVRLNSGKTHILDSAQATQHFRVQDHFELDAIQADLRNRHAFGIPTDILRQKIESTISIKYRNRDFDGGHGEKILKRLLTLAKQTSGHVHRSILLDILRRRPGCRQAALSYLSSRTLDRKTAALFEEFLSYSELVDDVPFLLAPSALVEMQATSRAALDRSLTRITGNLLTGGPWKLYGAIWLLSKYGSRERLLDILARHRFEWFSSPTLGRLVGGTTPRFLGSPLREHFMALIRDSGNPSAAESVRFHNQVFRHRHNVSALRRYLMAPNPSKGTGITHDKFLIILSIFLNPNVGDATKRSLIAKHDRAWRDAYYRHLAIEALPTHLRSLVI